MLAAVLMAALAGSRSLAAQPRHPGASAVSKGSPDTSRSPVPNASPISNVSPTPNVSPPSNVNPVSAVAAPSGGPAAAVLPVLRNLQTDAEQARRERKPIVLFFSQPGCQWCHQVRNSYLAPLLRDLAPVEQPVIREADITDQSVVVGFGGQQTSASAMAGEFRIRFTPTIVFLDSSGTELVRPLIGGDTTGLYGGLLDNALAESRQRLRQGSK